MRFHESETEATFRADARAWLAQNVPAQTRPHDGPASREFDLAWQRRQFEGGWAGVNWPVEYGGKALPIDLQIVWIEECVRAGAPTAGCLGGALNHAMPTLMRHGTQAQKDAHIAKVLAGEEVWCQGFSEPEAGSDLAGIRTRGVVDGDYLVVTGQKVWTSHADLADFQELLVRTDPDAPKHKGLTWVIYDMRSPGIDVRPIRLMAGDNHFAEIFYDEVRIPLANVVGGLNNGWTVAMSTLSFERGTAFMSEQMKLSRVAQELVELAKETPSPSGRGRAIDDGEFRAQLGQALIGAAALNAMTNQLVSKVAAEATVGAEASMVRIQFANVAQQIHRLAQRLRGADALVDDSESGNGSWTYDYLWSFQTSIGGGTREIQHNIVGDRHLLLPR